MPNNSTNKYEASKALFEQHGGLLRTSQAIRFGIHPETLYAMRDSGLLEQVSRGVFRLTGLPPLGNPDLVTTASRVPEGVICLISALDFHEITTQIPHLVYLAIARNARPAKIDYPPIRFFRFSDKAFTTGIETHTIDNVPVRIYSAEKTIADCFKFRNKVGQDVAVEALKLYRERRKFNIGEILRFAAICRVEKIMKPYIEAIL